MLALQIFQWLLNGMGWILAHIYDLIPNYGVSIIILTLLIRLVVLPLGIQQIKQMQAMQQINPKIKELQRKYKGNRQKIQEEQMKLYKEYGVSPFGGCLPILLQFPFLIAMYAVIRTPIPNADPPPQYLNNHLPVGSALYVNVTQHHNTDFLWVNLQCSASQSGKTVPVMNSAGKPSGQDLDCGDGVASKIPYFMFLGVMVATTFYQQYQMNRASPPGARTGQQQAIMKVFPVMFAVFGFTFPSGLVLYWTVSNAWQIGQQHVLFRMGHIGPDALEKRRLEQQSKPPKESWFGRLQSRMTEQQGRQSQASGRGSSKGGSGKPRGGSGKGSSRGSSGGRGTGKSGSGGKGGSKSTGSNGKSKQGPTRRPNTGGSTKPRRPNTGSSGKPTPKEPPKDQPEAGGGSGADGDGEAGS